MNSGAFILRSPPTAPHQRLLTRTTHFIPASDQQEQAFQNLEGRPSPWHVLPMYFDGEIYGVGV